MKGIYLILLMFSFGLSAQSLEEKVADEVCVCLNEDKLERKEDMQKSAERCAVKVLQKYMTELYDSGKFLEDSKSDEFWDIVMGILIKKCDAALELMLNTHQKEEEKPAILDCEDLKIGNYFYETNGKNYLAFTKNQVIENRKGSVYTISKIDWLDKCVYKLTLQETNSHFDETHMKNNPYTFKIIENHKDYFIVQTEYIEGAGLNNVKVYKLFYQNDTPEK